MCHQAVSLTFCSPEGSCASLKKNLLSVQTSWCICYGADEEVGTGEKVALQLAFSLPSSTYATMLVRELTKTSTATAFHKSLSQLAK